MIELELLGANGDSVVMTDARGTRYNIVVDDALRAAVRRERPSARPSAEEPPAPGTPVRPRDIQALLRSGASVQEVATATGLTVDHVSRFEGPVSAERHNAVRQAQSYRIGWEKDSPVLGELVVDRLATRGVDPATLSWDALRHGRDPWQITLTFIQGAEEKEARWELNLPARSVIALDDEARWLTEAASLGRRPSVFDQDTEASGASSHPEDAESVSPTGTDVLLEDLASNRGRRLTVLEPPEEDEDDIREADEEGQAQVLSMSDHRRAYGQASAQAPSEAPVTGAVHTLTGAVRTTAGVQTALTGTQRPVEEEIVQDGVLEEPRRSQRKRKRRQQVPSWDEIVFGAKPE